LHDTIDKISTQYSLSFRVTRKYEIEAMSFCGRKKCVVLSETQRVAVPARAVRTPLTQLISALGERQDKASLLCLGHKPIEGIALLFVQAAIIKFVLNQLGSESILSTIIQVPVIPSLEGSDFEGFRLSRQRLCSGKEDQRVFPAQTYREPLVSRDAA
jgi:hypothetical protein